MATIQPAAPTQAFSFGSVLSDLWDTGLRTFNSFVDHEFGAEVPLAQEAQASAMTIAAEQAPAPSVGGTIALSGWGLDLDSPWVWAAGGAAVLLVAFLLLRK